MRTKQAVLFGILMTFAGVAMADPITAIIGIASIASGVGAAAAATTVLSAVLVGAQIVGGALLLAGTVSGNEKLTKLGGIVSLAGGVGRLVQGLATAAPVAEELAAPSVGDTQAGTNVETFTDPSTEGSSLDTGPTTGVEGGGFGGTDTTVNTTLQTPVVQGSGTIDAAKNLSGDLVDQPPTELANKAPAGEMVDHPPSDLANKPPPKSQGWIQQILGVDNNFLKDNAELIKIAGEGLGALGPKGDLLEAQADYYKYKTGEDERNAARISASLQGVTIPMSVRTQPPPQPENPLSLYQRGLIASAMARRNA